MVVCSRHIILIFYCKLHESKMIPLSTSIVVSRTSIQSTALLLAPFEPFLVYKSWLLPSSALFSLNTALYVVSYDIKDLSAWHMWFLHDPDRTTDTSTKLLWIERWKSEKPYICRNDYHMPCLLAVWVVVASTEEKKRMSSTFCSTVPFSEQHFFVR